MSLRALAIVVLGSLGCANAGEGSEPVSDPTRDPPGIAFPPQPPDPAPGSSDCPLLGSACVSEFAVLLEASEPWPLGRYFLRVAINRDTPTVCEIAFESVVGAVTDTCNDQEHPFRVSYRYEDEKRAIDEVSFGSEARHVDLEILVAEDLPPVVEVHHDVVARKCTYACALAEPLVVQAQLGSTPSVDAGVDDAGAGTPDATPDAAVDAGLDAAL